jgi:hypothetical protein
MSEMTGTPLDTTGMDDFQRGYTLGQRDAGEVADELRDALAALRTRTEVQAKLLEAIISAYDGYRGKGVMPAAEEYQRMVQAINAARRGGETQGERT